MQTFFNSNNLIWNTEAVFKKQYLTLKQIEILTKFFTKDCKKWTRDYTCFNDSIFDKFINNIYNKDYNVLIDWLEINESRYWFKNTVSAKSYKINNKFWIQTKYLDLLSNLWIYRISFDIENQMIFTDSNIFIIKPILLT